MERPGNLTRGCAPNPDQGTLSPTKPRKIKQRRWKKTKKSRWSCQTMRMRSLQTTKTRSCLRRMPKLSCRLKTRLKPRFRWMRRSMVTTRMETVMEMGRRLSSKLMRCQRTLMRMRRKQQRMRLWDWALATAMKGFARRWKTGTLLGLRRVSGT